MNEIKGLHPNFVEGHNSITRNYPGNIILFEEVAKCFRRRWEQKEIRMKALVT